MSRLTLLMCFVVVTAVWPACIESASDDSGATDAGDTGSADIRAPFDLDQGDGGVDDTGHTGLFDVDPSTCSQLAAGIIELDGLTSELVFARYAVVRSSGQFASTEEAIAALEEVVNDGTGPTLDFEGPSSLRGGLERWESPPDYGAVAITDTRLNEVIFGGLVIWAGGPMGQARFPPTWSGNPTLRVTDVAAPDPPSTIPLIGYNEFPGNDVLRGAWDWASRTELVHAFAACGDYDALVYTYTPAVGELQPEHASALVFVTGTVTSDWLPEL